MTAKLLSAACMAAFVFLGACADSPSEPPPPPLPVHPQLSIVGGDLQVDTVMKTLPVQLAAQLTDKASGAPLADRVVNWVVIEGNGSVFALVSQTGSDGVARQSWTLGPTAGPQTLVARWLDPETGEPVTLDTARAAAVPDRPATFEVIPDRVDNRYLQGDTIRVAYRFYDRHGNRTSCSEYGYGLNVAWFPYPKDTVGPQQLGDYPIQYVGTISSGPEEAPEYEARFLSFNFSDGSTAFWIWARPRCLPGVYRDDFNAGPPAHGADSLVIGLRW